MAEFAALTVACLSAARRRSARATAWVAGMFGLLTSIILIGALWSARSHAQQTTVTWNIWVIKGFIAALAVAPYMMFRYSTRYSRASLPGETISAGLVAVIVVWTTFISKFVPPQAHQPLWAKLYGNLFLVTWVFLLSYTAVRMYRAGRGQPVVARMRMRLLGTSAGLFGLLVMLQTVMKTSQTHDGRAIALEFVTLGAGVVFFFGIVPPRVMRMAMHGRDWDSLQRTIGTLVAERRADAVLEAALGAVISSVGANGAAMLDEHGNVDGAVGIEASVAQSAGVWLRQGHTPAGVVVLPLARSSLVIWEGSCAPLIGKEELAVCGSIAGLAELALERCRVWESQERFIAHAAHELRTPLTTLVGVASTITHNTGRISDDDRAKLTESFERQALRAKTLVDNLLDLAKLGEGRINADADPVPLARAIAGALEAAPAPAGHHVRVLVPSSIVVTADRARLEQVFVNLLTNAYRYGGNEIAVHAQNGSNQVKIQVVDNGRGVPDQLAGSLFTAFVRGPNSSGKGSGLGLAISRGLVNAMGGSIAYRSAAGGGACFEVTLRSSNVAESLANAV